MHPRRSSLAYAPYPTPGKVSHVDSANSWRQRYAASGLGQQIQRNKAVQKEDFIKNRERLIPSPSIQHNAINVFKQLQPHRYYCAERNFAFSDSYHDLQTQSTIVKINSSNIIQSNQQQIILAEQQIKNLQSQYIDNLNNKIVNLNEKTLGVQEELIEQPGNIDMDCDLTPLVQQIQQFDQHMGQRNSVKDIQFSTKMTTNHKEQLSNYTQQNYNIAQELGYTNNYVKPNDISSRYGNLIYEQGNSQLQNLQDIPNQSMNSQRQDLLNASMNSQRQDLLNASMNSQRQDLLNASMNPQRQDLLNASMNSQRQDLLNASMNPQRQDLLNASMNPQRQDLLNASMNSQRQDIPNQSMNSQRQDLLNASMNSQRQDLLNASMNSQRQDIPNQSMNSQRQDILNQSMNPQRQDIPNQSMNPQRQDLLNASMNSQRQDLLNASMNLYRNDLPDPIPILKQKSHRSSTVVYQNDMYTTNQVIDAAYINNNLNDSILSAIDKDIIICPKEPKRKMSFATTSQFPKSSSLRNPGMYNSSVSHSDEQTQDSQSRSIFDNSLLSEDETVEKPLQQIEYQCQQTEPIYFHDGYAQTQKITKNQVKPIEIDIQHLNLDNMDALAKQYEEVQRLLEEAML
uniref:Uncharacterized protein n=1 Tax=Spironucleus salmonicida TaxID=348837 RepID=V6LPU9_9EUKA|eukprot:EST42779.1 hypothetical protein SS50377_17545 [Spironucleus salmonicida]